MSEEKTDQDIIGNLEAGSPESTEKLISTIQHGEGVTINGLTIYPLGWDYHRHIVEKEKVKRCSIEHLGEEKGAAKKNRHEFETPEEAIRFARKQNVTWSVLEHSVTREKEIYPRIDGKGKSWGDVVESATIDVPEYPSIEDAMSERADMINPRTGDFYGGCDAYHPYEVDLEKPAKNRGPSFRVRGSYYAFATTYDGAHPEEGIPLREYRLLHRYLKDDALSSELDLGKLMLADPLEAEASIGDLTIEINNYAKEKRKNIIRFRHSNNSEIELNSIPESRSDKDETALNVSCDVGAESTTALLEMLGNENLREVLDKLPLPSVLDLNIGEIHELFVSGEAVYESLDWVLEKTKWATSLYNLLSKRRLDRKS